MIKRVPNILTTIRLLLVPVFIVMFFQDHIASAAIFVVACLTDIVDGYIARHFDAQSKFGTVFDPLADKLLQLSAIICLYIAELFPIWALIVLVCKECLLLLGGANLLHRGVVVAANKYGKISTVVLSLFVISSILLGDILLPYINVIAFVAIIPTLLALGSYCRIFAGEHKKENSQSSGGRQGGISK